MAVGVMKQGDNYHYVLLTDWSVLLVSYLK